VEHKKDLFTVASLNREDQESIGNYSHRLQSARKSGSTCWVKAMTGSARRAKYFKKRLTNSAAMCRQPTMLPPFPQRNSFLTKQKRFSYQISRLGN
jgi:hypothetical protein